MNKFEELSNTLDDNDVEYFVEVDLKNPDNVRQRMKNLLIAHENKLVLKISLLHI